MLMRRPRKYFTIILDQMVRLKDETYTSTASLDGHIVRDSISVR